jgi:hypothetical protein
MMRRSGSNSVRADATTAQGTAARQPVHVSRYATLAARNIERILQVPAPTAREEQERTARQRLARRFTRTQVGEQASAEVRQSEVCIGYVLQLGRRGPVTLS